MSSFFNDLSTNFFRFGEYAISKDEDLKYSIEILKTHQTESFLSLFSDIRNSRKIFSKLFYGVCRKSILIYLENSNQTNSSIYHAFSELPVWSKFDCDSFKVDEESFQMIKIGHSGASPLSVMHDRIWEILNPAVQRLIQSYNN